MVKLNDLLGIALLLIGVFIFLISLRETGIVQLFGLVGSLVLVIIEIVFLWKMWVK